MGVRRNQEKAMARRAIRRDGVAQQHACGSETTNPRALSGTEQALEARYRLTDAEAALAAALANGARLSEYAATRGVRVSTLRTQLKRCFRKTATSRQADLIRLIIVDAPAAGE
jgi:DNA-binding CsgD family transcriptional regulator